MSPAAGMPVMPVLVVSVGSSKWSHGAVLLHGRDTGGPGGLRRDTGVLQVSAQTAEKVQEVPILKIHPHSGSKAPCHVPKPSSTLLWKPEITVAGLGICQLTVFSAVNTSLLKFKASQKRINCDKLPASQKSWKKAQKVKMSHL